MIPAILTAAAAVVFLPSITIIVLNGRVSSHNREYSRRGRRAVSKYQLAQSWYRIGHGAEGDELKAEGDAWQASMLSMGIRAEYPHRWGRKWDQRPEVQDAAALSS